MKTTKNYGLFTLWQGNRDINLRDPHTKNLAESMIDYSWIKSQPMTVGKRGKERIILDGQHRFSIAKEFEMPVVYVEIDIEGWSDSDINEFIRRVNNSSKNWSLRDYVNAQCNTGNSEYIELKKFSERHGLSIGISAALLAGVGTTGQMTRLLRNGAFKVKARERAELIALTVIQCNKVAPGFKTSRAISAVHNCFKVSGFDHERLINRVQAVPEKITNCAKTEDWYDQLEEVYNYKKQDRISLAFYAREAARRSNDKS